MTEKRLISFRQLKRLCTKAYVLKELNYTLVNCDKNKECNKANCPVWKRLEKNKKE